MLAIVSLAFPEQKIFNHLLVDNCIRTAKYAYII